MNAREKKQRQERLAALRLALVGGVGRNAESLSKSYGLPLNDVHSIIRSVL